MDEQKLNKIIDIKIDNLNINGEGITMLENTKVCVKNVLPKEEVSIEIQNQKNNFVSGKLISINSPSKNRITPPCPYYNKCGGCNFQFVESYNGLNIKKQIIADYFKNLYNKTITVTKSKNSFNYRNKASFFVSNGKVGFQKENTNEVVEIDQCLILNPTINTVLQVLKQWLKTYNQTSISHFVVRTLNDKTSVVVVAKRRVNNLSNLIDGLKNTLLEGNFGLYINLNANKHKILSENYVHIYGLKLLETNFKNIKYFVHPNSFMQVNDDVKNNLYNEVLNNIHSSNVVIEGYSGAGLLSALISTKAQKVFAVEINKHATQDANNVKQQNSLSNLQNINGDCSIVLPKLIEKYPNAVFVIDPARNGCDKKTLQAVKNSNIKKIIYISCNPYTLKQNIVFLGDSYKITKLQLFDMFPQTFHIETLAVIEKI